DDSDFDGSWIKSFKPEDIPRDKLKVEFVRSSGPGGQNVNKVSTKAQMRFTLGTADWLPAEVRKKLREQHANRLNKKDEFIIQSDRTRSQLENHEDCIAKLYEFIEKAAFVPEGPSQELLDRIEERKEESKEKKMKGKQHHAKKKQDRRWKDF
ncbi:hypothetical protein HK104_007546, partial [Borealophlyctis nickersoniae]